EVLTGEAVAIDETGNRFAQCRREVTAAFGLSCQEDRVPASGPAQVRYSFVYLCIALGDGHVIGHGDGAFLGEEGLWGAAADLVGSFGVDAADGGQWVCALDDAGVGRVKEDEALSTDIAHDAIPNA